MAYFLIKPQEVKVPDVKGLSLEEASLIIKKAGLKVGQVQGTGFVDRTYPYAGDVVRKGREITLFLSDPFELAVPNLVGAPKETAEKILLAMGFKVRIVQLPYKGTDGRVLGVYPPPGSKLKEGGEVSLLVDVGEP
ncbi:PASTA domain-containing protein [Pseudothermotoga thermarum]|uniref:PASTA domain-containing protein n=1 Tax=Pseudothermotoga thermarum TaxID=119394 RepID=UPI001FE0FCD8|nr:PASTA domain-containing protein [Pseudothermotoga thermarum]